MKKFEKGLLIVLVILFVLTLIANIFNYNDTNSLFLVGIILLFNAFFLVGVFCITHFIKERIERNYVLFIFFFLIVIILYWYLLSEIFSIYYGSFISLGGLFFFYMVQSTGIILLVLIGSILIIIGFTGLFYHLYYKDFENNKRYKARYVILIITLLIIMVILIPRAYVQDSTPHIAALKNIIKPSWLKIDKEIPLTSKEPVLNINLQTKNPNIIIILLESVPAKHMTFNGYERNVTPNIDKFANQNIVFNNAYSSASHTSQAQPVLLSSRYALVNKIGNDFKKDYPKTFMWDILKNNGYNTSLFSAADLNTFNLIEYLNQKNLDIFWHSITDGKFDYIFTNEKKDYDERVVNKAIEWIDSLNNSDPFFTYINFQANHYPFIYPNESSLFKPEKDKSVFTNYLYVAEEDWEPTINRYDNALHYTDKQIGILLDYLDERGLLNNTIIILTSDHGESLNERPQGIMHGFGVYEEEIKVPLIFSIPGEKHKEIDEKVRLIDVIPTILNISGFSLSDNFQGRVMTKDPLIFSYAQNQNNKIGIIKGDLKYTLDLNSYVPEAYNLTSDPKEINNLIKTEKDRQFYANRYGYILFKWYDCQINYYKKELWKKGEKIGCNY